jgi:putative hydrolase
VTPLEALDGAVYLLDRGFEPAFKVKAFLQAARVVATLPEGEVERRAAAGTLEELDHIGPATARLVTEALQGGIPAYLVELEAKTRLTPANEEAAVLRAALRGDCHSHSTWSDGGAPIEAMARTARQLGHDYLVVTDHSPRLAVARGLTRERLEAQLDEIDRLNGELAPFRVLTGIEVDILPDGSLDQDDDLLDRLDVVVASVHSEFRMPADAMTARLVTAIANPRSDIVGHITNRMQPRQGERRRNGRDPSQFDAEVVFAACHQFDTAVEVNCRPERRDPPDELLRLAVEWDCRIAIDTDAHAPGQLEWQQLGCDTAAACGIAADRVVNAMGADGLLEWAATKAA